MLPLLACLSVAINCYQRGTTANEQCIGLPEDDCLTPSATFPTLRGCKWSSSGSGTCTSVCAHSYRKAPTLDEDGKLHFIQLQKDHCYERAGAASVGVCIAPYSMQGGSAEENAALLEKFPGVLGYVDDISIVSKTLIPTDVYTFRSNEDVTIFWRDFKLDDVRPKGTVIFTIAGKGDTLSVKVVKNGASLTVSPQSAQQVTVTLKDKIDLHQSIEIVFNAGGDDDYERAIQATFKGVTKHAKLYKNTVVIAPRETKDFKEMFLTEDPDRIMTPAFEAATALNIYFKTKKHFISLQALAALAKKRTAGEEFSPATLHGIPSPAMYWFPDGLFDIPKIGNFPYIKDGKTKYLPLDVPNDEYEDILDTFPEEVTSAASGGSYNPFGRFASDVDIYVHLIMGDDVKEDFKKAMKASIEESVGDQTLLIKYTRTEQETNTCEFKLGGPA